MDYEIWLGKGHVRMVSGDEAAWDWFNLYAEIAKDTESYALLIDAETGEVLADSREKE